MKASDIKPLKPCPFFGGESFHKEINNQIIINCSVCGIHAYSKEEYNFGMANYKNILKCAKLT
jgi:hypothetical protein